MNLPHSLLCFWYFSQFVTICYNFWQFLIIFHNFSQFFTIYHNFSQFIKMIQNHIIFNSWVENQQFRRIYTSYKQNNTVFWKHIASQTLYSTNLDCNSLRIFFRIWNLSSIEFLTQKLVYNVLKMDLDPCVNKNMYVSFAQLEMEGNVTTSTPKQPS